MAKNRVSKSCLIAELCYHPFVHFNCAPICIFGPNQKQCARYQKGFIFVKFTSDVQQSGSALKERNVSATAVRWFASETAHIVFIHRTPVVKSVHIFMARNRLSKSCLMAELCFYRFVHFRCVLIGIFGFHHKPCARDQKDFIYLCEMTRAK